MTEFHPAVANVLRYFAYRHLPPHLQDVSRPFHDLAHEAARMVPDGGPAVTDGLKDLLRAKDWFVRAAVDSDPG